MEWTTTGSALRPDFTGLLRERRMQVSETIFCVEDDRDICRLIQLHLTQAGYHVECFGNVDEALSRAKTTTPSLFLLDIMLPGESGLDFCRELKAVEEFARIPVILVTAKTSQEDRIRGLEFGADDYVTKPFSPRELVLRVKAALRRGQPEAQADVVRFGNVEIDISAMILRVNGLERKTTALEFRILETLARSPGRVFSRERLLILASGTERDVSPRSVDVYVSGIREKIEPDPAHPVYLQTVRGAGYRFFLHEPVALNGNADASAPARS
ncbi:MAG: response regulator [Candidatus Korobacteraceae bacterium]